MIEQSKSNTQLLAEWRQNTVYAPAPLTNEELFRNAREIARSTPGYIETPDLPHYSALDLNNRLGMKIYCLAEEMRRLFDACIDNAPFEANANRYKGWIMHFDLRH